LRAFPPCPRPIAKAGDGTRPSAWFSRDRPAPTTGTAAPGTPPINVYSGRTRPSRGHRGGAGHKIVIVSVICSCASQSPVPGKRRPIPCNVPAATSSRKAQPSINLPSRPASGGVREPGFRRTGPSPRPREPVISPAELNPPKSPAEGSPVAIPRHQQPHTARPGHPVPPNNGVAGRATERCAPIQAPVAGKITGYRKTGPFRSRRCNSVIEQPRDRPSVPGERYRRPAAQKMVPRAPETSYPVLRPVILGAEVSVPPNRRGRTAGQCWAWHSTGIHATRIR